MNSRMRAIILLLTEGRGRGRVLSSTLSRRPATSSELRRRSLQQLCQPRREFAARQGQLVAGFAGGLQRFQIYVRRESDHARGGRRGADLFQRVERGKRRI